VVTAGVAAKYVEEALKKVRFEASVLRIAACTVPTPMEDLIEAIGVQGLYVVDPYNLFETEDALAKAKNREGPKLL